MRKSKEVKINYVFRGDTCNNIWELHTDREVMYYVSSQYLSIAYPRCCRNHST